MNKLSRALGRWLYDPYYKCRICNQLMNINEGLVLDPRNEARVMHKECKENERKNRTTS